MSDATAKRLKVSREGVILIKSFEGFRPRAVRDEAGGWVIGYGHSASAREGLTVGEQDAELLLQYDLLPVVSALNERVKAPLNQHQFDALASFAISVGLDRFLQSDVLEQLNDGHTGEAADALIGWPEAAAPDAHLRRRAAERALFVADPATPMRLSDLLAAPLPPPPVEEAPAVPPAPDARASAIASLLGEAPAVATPNPAPTAPVAEPEVETPAPDVAEPTPPQPIASRHLHRYSPYAATIVGPLPGFPVIAAAPKPPVEPVTPPEPVTGTPPSVGPDPEPEVPEVPQAPETPATPTTPEAADPQPAPSPPVVPLVPPEPGRSPFPPIEPPLVLTPATEADFATVERPLWEAEQRPAPTPAATEAPLFEDEPTQSVLRHEVDAAPPRRFDWSVTGAFLIMGATGLVACAAAAAAFRKAMTDASPLDDYVVIGWVLALIGVICVGVSSWNLYVKWTRRD